MNFMNGGNLSENSLEGCFRIRGFLPPKTPFPPIECLENFGPQLDRLLLQLSTHQKKITQKESTFFQSKKLSILNLESIGVFFHRRIPFKKKMWGTCDISKPTYFFPSLFSWGIPPVYRGSHPSSPQRSTNVPKKKYPPQKRGKKRGGDGVPSGNERTTAFGKFIEKSWLLRRLHVKAS